MSNLFISILQIHTPHVLSLLTSLSTKRDKKPFFFSICQKDFTQKINSKFLISNREKVTLTSTTAQLFLPLYLYSNRRKNRLFNNKSVFVRPTQTTPRLRYSPQSRYCFRQPFNPFKDPASFNKLWFFSTRQELVASFI